MLAAAKTTNLVQRKRILQTSPFVVVIMTYQVCTLYLRDITDRIIDLGSDIRELVAPMQHIDS
jgi:hypothetical protein